MTKICIFGAGSIGGFIATSLKKTNSEVYVATPDQKVIDVVNQNRGKAVLTSTDHQTGTDRIYEVFKDHLKSEPNLIINLQGDMQNI